MAAGTAPQSQMYRMIGKGNCGSVWTPVSQHDPFYGCAFKREDWASSGSLLKEIDNYSFIASLMRQLIAIVTLVDPNDPKARLSVRVSIPYCYRLLDGCSLEYKIWWEEHKSKFPREFIRCTTLQMERIPSMPKKVRNLLIDTFCPKTLVGTVKANDTVGDCLVRPYFGRRRQYKIEDEGQHSMSTYPAFSLRSFPLHMDQVEKLGIPLPHYIHITSMMGESLAMIHWLAELDSNGIEFVLAPPRAGSTNYLSDDVFGNYTLWLLDFDGCNHITMDDRGVDQAVAAFFRNDRYYPCTKASQGLFNVFVEMYLGTSGCIIRHRRLGGEMVNPALPQLFIQSVRLKDKRDKESANLLN